MPWETIAIAVVKELITAAIKLAKAAGMKKEEVDQQFTELWDFVKESEPENLPDPN